ncbi:hypothetical protein BGW80DRAFT_1443800 [Lactifluus volemus]|nr:hypothetical protein BGW80DRAFT_1443800 [Lactifluus volemus]
MSSSQQETDLSMSNFVEIFRAASENYKKLTKHDLESHPFAAKLDSCDSPTATLDLFRKQAHDFDEFRKGDESLIRWLYPTVNVLTQFSEIIRAGVELVPFSPAKMIFTAISVLLVAAKDVVASHETLVKLFEHVQFFLQRLVIYTEIPLTPEMVELLGKIMSQLLSILALSTKEMDKRFQKRFRRFLKILVGKKDVEDALQELDRLTQEETRLMIAKNVELAHHVEQSAP